MAQVFSSPSSCPLPWGPSRTTPQGAGPLGLPNVLRRQDTCPELRSGLGPPDLPTLREGSCLLLTGGILYGPRPMVRLRLCISSPPLPAGYARRQFPPPARSEGHVPRIEPLRLCRRVTLLELRSNPPGPSGSMLIGNCLPPRGGRGVPLRQGPTVEDPLSLPGELRSPCLWHGGTPSEAWGPTLFPCVKLSLGIM